MADSPRGRRGRSRKSQNSSDSDARLSTDDESLDGDGLQVGGHILRSRRRVGEEEEEEDGSKSVPPPSPLREYSREPGTSRRRAHTEEKQKRKGEKKTKTFDEFVREDELRRVGFINKGKTMNDYDYRGRGQRTEGSDKGGNTLVLVVIAALCAFGWFWLGHSSDEGGLNSDGNPINHFKWEDLRTKLEQESRKLHQLFPSQSKDTIVSIYAAVHSTMEDKEPKQPSCLVLLSPEDVPIQFPTCFSQTIGNVVNNMFSEASGSSAPPALTLNTKYFNKFGDDMTRLYSEIEYYFNTGGRVIVVEDVEAVNRENHLIVFHGLCDNFKAPQKRATVLFIVRVPRNFCSQGSTNDCENISGLTHTLLDSAWKTVSNDDSRPAIIARVAGHSALLKMGDTCT